MLGLCSQQFIFFVTLELVQYDLTLPYLAYPNLTLPYLTYPNLT
jgi:hypothetical protein